MLQDNSMGEATKKEAPRWPTFPTPFHYGDGVAPLTQKELIFVMMSASIRQKPEWWTKIHDAEIVEKWRVEAQGLVGKEGWNYLLAELKCYSRQITTQAGVSGGDIRISPVDGVFESDTLIPDQVRNDLLEGVSKLEVCHADSHVCHVQ